MIYRRSTKISNYTVISNTTLRDPAIKPESLGVLSYLLSHREDWQVTNKALSTHFGISTGRVSKITQDLASHGYLRRDNTSNSDGKIVRWDWIVFDEPHPENPDLENPDLENPDLENAIQRSTIYTEEHITSKCSWKDDLNAAKPEAVSQAAWDKWWNYKSPKRKPAQRVLANGLLRFEALVKDGHTDFDPVIDMAIANGWQSVPDPDWNQIKQLKKSSWDISILAMVP